jgi:hypothetical protein
MQQWRHVWSATYISRRLDAVPEMTVGFVLHGESCGEFCQLVFSNLFMPAKFLERDEETCNTGKTNPRRGAASVVPEFSIF